MNLHKKGVVILASVLLALAAGGGYLLWKKKGGGAPEPTVQALVQYTCSMHPFIIKDRPGTCPICGMALIKKINPTAQGPAAASVPQGAADVAVSPNQRVMANVATVAAARLSLSKEIVATGIVQFDQSRQAKVTAWVAGRIDRLFVDTVGASVSKGKPVAELYSPDLVAAQQEYLLALKSREQFKKSSIQAISQGGEGLVSSARQRLRLLGVKDEQIAHLEKAGEPNIRLSIYTPLSGIVIEKMVQQGQYVNLGEALFSIADLSQVWVEAEVYENEFPLVKLGQKVEITSQSYPGKVFSGRVSFIYPFLDPKTRTVKVRVELQNPGLRLKPDMFVKVQIKIPLGSVLALPASAVIDTGKRQVVWVEREPGRFEPRDVQVGARVDDQVQILKGVAAGEKVAATGGYLIDSESQLRGEGPKPPAGTPTPAAPPQKKGGTLNMDDMKM